MDVESQLKSATAVEEDDDYVDEETNTPVRARSIVSINDDSDAHYLQSLKQYSWKDVDEVPIAFSKRLHRLNVTFLFNELYTLRRDIEQNDIEDRAQLEQLSSLMHRYTDAVRDYQYMKQLTKLPSSSTARVKNELQTAFVMISEPDQASRQPSDKSTTLRDNSFYDTTYLTVKGKSIQKQDTIRKFLVWCLPKDWTWTSQEQKLRGAAYANGKLPEHYSNTVDIIARFLVGLIGGGWLIVPLLIMALNQTFVKTIVTVCVATVLFALSISHFMDMDNKDTISATAAYAAVLVVFVGTSTPGTGGS